MILQLLEFFFQSFSHWLGGLIYISVSFWCFGFGFGIIAGLFRGK